MSPVALVLAAQMAAPAIVARVEAVDAKLRDLEARARIEIVDGEERRTRVLELRLLRRGDEHRVRLRLVEPPEMAGLELLVVAERAKRNRQWAYFPELDLVRAIAPREDDAPLLGSDLTYADLGGAAHLHDLRHRLVGEETVDGVPCYVMEGVPKHRIAYGKLRGWIRKDLFVVLRARFFDREGRLVKEARLGDLRTVDGVPLAHRIEIVRPGGTRRTVVTLDEVRVNQGLSAEAFEPSALGRTASGSEGR